MTEYQKYTGYQTLNAVDAADFFAADETWTVTREQAADIAKTFRAATIDLTDRVYASGDIVIGGTAVIWEGDPV